MKKIIFIYFFGILFGGYKIGFDSRMQSFGLDLVDKFYLTNEYTDEKIINGHTNMYPIIIGYDFSYKYKNFNYGIGIETMTARGSKEFSNGKISFNSLYGFIKYNVLKDYYLISRIGYNTQSANSYWIECHACEINLNDGIVYGYGLGIGDIELMYIVHNVSTELNVYDNTYYKDQKFNIKYIRFNFSLNLNFKIKNILY